MEMLISFSSRTFSTWPQCQNPFQVLCWPWYYIYIYTFSRRFYPKRLTLHSSYSFYILSALAFPGNRTHDLGVASAMLYHLSYRKACILVCLIGQPTCLTWTPYGIYGIFSRERWETVNPTIQTSWRLNSASAEPQADRFHATPHWCWNLC